MPIDLEMILSASPPVFNTASFMDFGYGHFRGPRNNRHADFNAAMEDFENNVRSCLMAKHHQGDNGKKRVWFADDKGLALTHVKIMSEPSNCPPKWTDEFLAQVVKGVKPNPTSDVQWVVQFPQPASDYMAFRDKVQKNCVSLENVIVREGDDTITGTIKVKNIAFDKEVFLRVTFDKWKSSTDVQAVFAPSGVQSSSQFDTFSFTLCVPSSATKFGAIEFCVCFRCSGTEYWDNNDGENYKVAAMSAKSPIVMTPSPTKKVSDTLQVNIHRWSEFASWNHLITEGPYW